MDITSTLVPAGDAAAFGALLRAAREGRGLSIQELSDDTRIPRGHVEALEQGDLGLVPPGLYRRAEVRAYAERVGLDVPLALAQLRSASAPATMSDPMEAHRPAPPDSLDSPLVHVTSLDSDSACEDAPPLDPPDLPGAWPPAPAMPRLAPTAPPRSPAVAPLAPAAVGQPRVVGVVALAAFCAGILLGERTARDAGSEEQIEGESPAMQTAPPFAQLARLASTGAAELAASAAVEDDEGEAPTLMVGRTPRLFARPSEGPGASEFGVLVVHTQPEGARVTVNGIGRGITPVTIRRLLLGSQRVRAAKDGYISEERVVSLGSDGLTRSLRMELRPLTGRRAAAPAGDPVLVVTSRPEGARVTVNGIGWGLTPITVRHLPQGPQRVRLTKDQYLSEERVVQLGAGRNNIVNVSLRSMR
jgi:transcriptional regulator with XRE-family HTH domain